MELPQTRVSTSPAGAPAAAPVIDPSLVRAAARAVARQHRLAALDAEELESNLWVKLLAHDGRALRSYAGKATPLHFLRVVATRVLLDMRTSLWGKWRPTAAARRLGPGAVTLERLVHRDGLPPAEALRRVTDAPDGPGLAEHLRGVRPRARRHMVGIEEAAPCAATSGPDPDVHVRHAERRRLGRTSAAALAGALRALPSDDRELLRLRFCEGRTVIDIARQLGLDQRALYRRLARLLTGLRHSLAASGVSVHQAMDVVGKSDVYIPPVLTRARAPRASAG